jgi:hypothetical protein
MSEGARASGSKPRLTYFKIMGVAEGARLIFADLGEEVENDYVEGDWAERKAAGVAVRGRARERRVAAAEAFSALGGRLRVAGRPRNAERGRV